VNEAAVANTIEDRGNHAFVPAADAPERTLRARRELRLALGDTLAESLANLLHVHRYAGGSVLLGADVAPQRLKVLDLE
jgi:hypothetical protein